MSEYFLRLLPAGPDSIVGSRSWGLSSMVSALVTAGAAVRCFFLSHQHTAIQFYFLNHDVVWVTVFWTIQEFPKTGENNSKGTVSLQTQLLSGSIHEEAQPLSQFLHHIFNTNFQCSSTRPTPPPASNWDPPIPQTSRSPHWT